MACILLDTCVLSEIRHPQGNAGVKSSVERLVDSDIFVSVISFGEIRRGILLMSAGRQSAELADWLADLEATLARQTLSVDLGVARRWAELTVSCRKKGRQIATADGLIAATALENGLTVMTRNVRDFEPTGVALVNPWLPTPG